MGYRERGEEGRRGSCGVYREGTNRGLLRMCERFAILLINFLPTYLRLYTSFTICSITVVNTLTEAPHCVYCDLYVFCTGPVHVVSYGGVLVLMHVCTYVCTYVRSGSSPSGDMYEVGMDRGRYYSVNLPLKDGIDDLSECGHARVVWCGMVWGGGY